MTTQTKNRIGLIGFIVLAVGAAGYFGLPYWRAYQSRTHFDQIDVSKYTDQQVLDFISRLNLAALSMQDRYGLLDRLEAWMKEKSMLDRMKFFADASALMKKDPKGQFAENGRSLMDTMFRKKMKEYAKATPDERAKIIDERVSEQAAIERAQQVAQLFGSKTDPAADASKMQAQIGDAIGKSIVDGDPDERAGAGQYFVDLRSARQRAGLRTWW
jgi:hypothetical protein